MRNISVFVICLILVLVSCKKEEKQPSNSNTNTGGGGTYLIPSSATAFSGIFTTGNYVGSTIVGSTTYTFNSILARAYFSSAPQAYMNSGTAVTVNSVYLNSDSLAYSTTSQYYNSSGTVNIASETWSVNGANGIGTFTMTHNITTPSASGYLNFPDSISISTGFSVSINNVANAKVANLLLSDGVGGFHVKTLQTGNNSVTVTPNDLSVISTSTVGYIALLLTNKKAYVFSNKDYEFNREYQYTKSIKIKP
jgi:hypothetical protein